MSARSLLLGLTSAGTVLVLASAGGCYNPEGGAMLMSRYTGAASTYWSTEQYPVTITVVDTRTEQPFFTMEVPVGKQLTMDFKDGGGDDPVTTPDLMRWEVFDRGTQVGALRNAMTCPNRYSRRVDVDYRTGPEYAPRPKDQDIRVDRENPDWWSSQGGTNPKANQGTTLYDDK